MIGNRNSSSIFSTKFNIKFPDNPMRDYSVVSCVHTEGRGTTYEYSQRTVARFSKYMSYNSSELVFKAVSDNYSETFES